MASVDAIAVPDEATSATIRVNFAMPVAGVDFQPAERVTLIAPPPKEQQKESKKQP